MRYRPTESELEKKPRRWEIRHLFYVIALYAAGFSLWGASGAIAATIYLSVWAFYFAGKLNLPTARVIGIIVAAQCLFVAVGEPQVVRVRSAASRISCHNNVKQICLAMQNYYSAAGQLPNALVRGVDGQPWHSWRLALTPYLEHSNLYDRYAQNEPWNGVSNRKLLAEMSGIFSCRSNETVSKTPYKLITGFNTAFESGKSFSFTGEHDSPSSIIVLVEDVASPVPWLEPKDLTVDEAIAILSSKERTHCAHCVEGVYGTQLSGNVVGFLDGSVRIIPPGADPEILRQAIDPYDGIAPELNFEDPKIKFVRWQGYLSLGLLLWLFALPILRVGRNEPDNSDPT